MLRHGPWLTRKALLNFHLKFISATTHVRLSLLFFRDKSGMDQQMHRAVSNTETSDPRSSDSEDYKDPAWDGSVLGNASDSDSCDDSDYKDAECSDKTPALSQHLIAHSKVSMMHQDKQMESQQHDTDTATIQVHCRTTIHRTENTVQYVTETKPNQQVTVEVRNETPAQPVPTVHQMNEGSVEETYQQPSLHPESSNDKRWWEFWKHDFGNDLAVENNWHKIISRDATAFKNVILCLCKTKKPHTILKILDKCFGNTFSFDFPFYLVVHQWLFRIKEPEDDQLRCFRKKCVTAMEKMDQNHLIETLLDFMTIKGFSVALQKGEENVFHLLRDSSMQMSKESMLSQQSHLLYRKLLWISIILRCDMECTPFWGAEKIWNTHLLEDKDLPIFDSEAKEDIRKGFRLIEFLHIAPNYQLSTDQMVVLATGRARWIQFDEIMNYAIAIAGSIPKPVFFLRQLYYAYIDKLTHVPQDTFNMKTCIEGLHFVNNFNSLLRDHVITEEQCQHEHELLQWLLQIALTSIHRAETVQCLGLFFGRNKLISDLHSQDLIQQAIERVKMKASELTVKQLHSIYMTADIWPKEILQTYCIDCKTMSRGIIKKPEWTEFLTLIVTRFPDAGMHSFLLELLKRYSKSYQAQEPMAFITDMMQLKVPNLFAQGNNDEDRRVRSEFITFLQDYVQRNSLREMLLNKILDCISQFHQANGFCQIVDTALEKIVAPQLHELSSKSRLPIVLQGAIRELQKSTTKKTLSYVDEFCWSIVAKCCSMIQITEMDFGWLEMHYEPIKELCTLSLTASKPSNKNISQYIMWLSNLKDVLSIWKNKIRIGDCNYDEILLCNAHCTQLCQLEHCVSNENLEVSWNVKRLRQQFEKQFVELNKALVLSTPANPEMCITLHHVLHMHDINIPADVSKYLILPGLSCANGKLQNLARLESIVQSEIHHNVCVHVNNATTKQILDQIKQELANFLRPLNQWILTLAYFGLNKCAIFNQYMEFQLSIVLEQQTKKKTLDFLDENTETVQKDNKINNFAERTGKAISCIVKLIEGKLTYSQMITDQQVDLMQLDIDAEFIILRNFAELNLIPIESKHGLDGLKDLLELFQLPEHIDCIHAVCKQYKLEGCLTDPTLIELIKTTEYLKSTQSKEEVTPVDAVHQLNRLKVYLCYNKPNAEHCIKLFRAVANCSPFHSFVLQMKFDGEDGRILFGQQYQLITAQLQHEEYNEDVLNHLTTAYNLITPFLNTKQKLHTLMSQVTQLDMSHGLNELQTVNENIATIHVWFSRVEGDTFENLSRELDSISQTAIYEFSFQQHCSVIFSLVCSEEKRMSREQLSDFMRRLGFLDAGGEKINLFRQINEMAEVLLTLYTQLVASGHSSYLQGCIRLKCDINHLKDKVDETKQILLHWRHKLTILRCNNPWLMFFSILKLLLIYKKIQSELNQPTDDCLFHEIGFLFPCDLVAIKELNTKMKIFLEKSKDTLQCESQIDAVSAFITDLLTNHTLQTPIKDLVLASNQTSAREHFTIHLHSCSNRNLIPTILSIFKGVPAVFQVFQCHEHTTEDELSLFLQRADQHAFLHLLLEINKLSFQMQEFLIQHFGRRRSFQSGIKVTHQVLNVELLETSHSSLRELPWITNDEYKNIEQCTLELLVGVSPKVQLIHGKAGDGKTHYIKKQIASSTASTVISINEAFTLLSAIEKLRCLPCKQDCAVHINFLLISTQMDTEQLECKRLFAVIWQFFFELFVLGYVEDPSSGLSFRLSLGLNWTFYIEVPCHSTDQDPQLALEQLCDKIPLFNVIGTPLLISQQIPFSVTPDVQLVCKYLKAYQDGRIDNVLTEDDTESDEENEFDNVIIKFSTDPDLLDDECQNLLKHYGKHLCDRKIMLQLFVKYMYERCNVLDKSPYFNYNSGIGEKTQSGAQTDTRHLGSTILSRMLMEVHEFCDSAIIKDWNSIPHHQLIYEIRDEGASMGFITSKPEELSNSDKTKLCAIGVKIPSIVQLHSRELLDGYLSRALNIELQDGRILKAIDDEKYVLTLDYTIKMLSIYERCRCKVPIIIQGETGVGKTALLKMLSVLWNHSFKTEWNTARSRLCDFLKSQTRIVNINTDQYRDFISAIEVKNATSYSDLLEICQQNPSFNMQVKNYLLSMRSLFVIPLLQSEDKRSLKNLFCDVETSDDPQVIASLLLWMCSAQLRTTFHKVLMHSALTPRDINTTLRKIFEEANMLRELSENVSEKQSHVEVQSSSRVPTVILFLDEINTASCLALLKELIVDQTLNGEPIPDNVFIVAACNPHCGSSLASHNDGEWHRGSYYVRPLPPTLQLILWDYGSLSKEQERQYIAVKMKMFDHAMTDLQLANLSNCIVNSQELMRDYAFQQLKPIYGDAEAKRRSHSCVSQRDIERVLHLYQWILKCYETTKRRIGGKNHHRYAVMIALGLVYYMRLNKVFRDKYRKHIDSNLLPGDISFQDAFNQELNYYCDSIDLPPGIAKTQALKENIFATIVCTVTRIPLIIVGAPGSSKTLSFNIVVSNLKGQESKKELFRMSTIFPSLDPHYYQCSKRTTSIEVSTVFLRAENRQQSHSKMLVPTNCVVFMDEAGLPEESHESLKVLHYYLDKSEVSFVAITNHVLDAAKTNRAISLFRPESAEDDLEILAKGCLSSKSQSENEVVVCLCDAYLSVTRQGISHFGLRDFIHFINFLRRSTNPHEYLSTIVMKGLERNFNGFENFDLICTTFLEKIGTSLIQVKKRHILDILHESLHDKPNNAEYNNENEIRYKLIIDPSEDDSLVRLLFVTRCLDRQSTRIFVSSDLSGDNDLEKVNTIAAIIHSMREGHTIVMTQTDDIHESFYDLFNQHFRKISDPMKGTRYYTNIAIGAHSKPCRVHPNFQCVVVVKKSEVLHLPPPFLNRFEKYCLTHQSILDAALQQLPPYMSSIIKSIRHKVQEFTIVLKEDESFHGFKPETIDSLLLSVMPVDNYTFKPGPITPTFMDSSNVLMKIIQSIQYVLQNWAGFQFLSCTMEELEVDCKHVFSYICADSVFDGLIGTEVPVVDAVSEAFCMLNTPDSEQCSLKQGMSPYACMVVSILVQWLVRYLCKRLMQVMTPEALTIHRGKIASTYIHNYLQFQIHFSLKKLITTSYRTLQIDGESFKPTKLLCYTRSSSILHKLPMVYPYDNSRVEESERLSRDSVQELVFDMDSNVMVLKLSYQSSAASIMEVLKEFTQNKSTNILLLIVNMQDISIKAINHVRIMIEEAENKVQLKNKLYVLLLHFSNSAKHYPTLFMSGWDHHYIDTISSNHEKGILDVEYWFKQCCFSQTHIEPDDSLTCTLRSLLHECIPILSSQVIFGNADHRKAPFNTKLSLSERQTILHKLLFTKRVGFILCDRFRSYWTPSIMASYVEHAARISHSEQSTISITAPIHTSVKVLFFDFMVHMIALINNHCNLDLLFTSDCSQPVEQLFGDILYIYPIPSFEQLKKLNNIHIASRMSIPGQLPSFPFFHMVLKQMDQLVENCREEVNKRIDLLTESTTSASSKTMTIHNILEKMADKGDSDDCLAITWKAINDSQELWHRYFNDFSYYKMNLLCTSELDLQHGLVTSMLRVNNDLNNCRKMLRLHAYISEHQVDVAKMTTILRPLELLNRTLGSLHANVKALPAESNNFQPDYAFIVSGFIVDVLFDALAAISFAEIDTTKAASQLKNWQCAYKDTITLPSMKEHIYRSLDLCMNSQGTGLKYRFDIMQAMFAVLQSTSDSSKECNDRQLTILGNVHSCFNIAEADQKPSREPRQHCTLAQMFSIVMKYDIPGIHSERLIESLFSHFICDLHTSGYNENDCEFFLQMANEQYQWLQEVTHSTMPATRPNYLIPHVSINVFKLYLTRILMCKQDTDQLAEPCGLYPIRLRAMVAKVLLSANDLDKPGNYIPLCYQLCPNIAIKKDTLSYRMNQPLAHLYFLTVMESFLKLYGGHEVTYLATIVQRIDEGCRSEGADDTILLFIELQAAVQVFIQRLALLFDPENPQKMHPIIRVVDSINLILADTTTGGGACRGHSHVLLLHILKNVKHDKFFLLLTEKYDSMCKGICSFDETNAQMKSFTLQPRDILSFYLDEEMVFYNLISQLMTEQCIPGLLKVADECNATSRKAGLFRMMVWLVAYYEFYDKGKISVSLSEAIEAAEFSQYFEEGEIRLIQSFINSNIMVNNPEIATEKIDYRAEEGDDNNNEAHLNDQDSTGKKEKRDPVRELFMLQQTEDVHIRHALANLTAAIIASPRRGNTLWYHLFAPEELYDTCIPGVLLNEKVNGNPYHYDCGIELDDDGLPARWYYRSPSCSLNSYYLLLWANIGAICMGLLTQPDTDRKIHGALFSTWLPLRHYYVAQIRQLWQFFHEQQSSEKSPADCTILISKCLRRFHEVSTDPSVSKHIQGRFDTIEEVVKYEKIWQKMLESALNTKLEQHSQNSLLDEIILFKKCYPLFHTMDEVKYSLNEFKCCDLFLLKQFMLNYDRLEVGECLLPDIVEFYQWLHKHLAHIVTVEKATELPIHGVVNLAAKRMSKSDQSERLLALYNRCKTNYNLYVQTVNGMIGADVCHQSNQISPINDETPLLYFLSDTIESEEGNDCLYNVMIDIVNVHNGLIERLEQKAQTENLVEIIQLLPTLLHRVSLTEFAECHCIVRQKCTSFLQLARSRCCQATHEIDFTLLQDDVIRLYCIGKPVIDHPKAIRTPFKFCNSANPQPHNPAFVTYTSEETIMKLKKKLPAAPQQSAEDPIMKEFEFEFHSADYSALLGALQFLSIVLGHLYLDSSETESIKEEVVSQKVHQLLEHLGDLCSTVQHTTHGCSQSQVHFLHDLPVYLVVECYEQFIIWLKDEIYNFHDLPFAVKSHLLPEDKKKIHEIPSQWKSDLNTLTDELSCMTTNLINSEQILIMTTNEGSQTSIVQFLHNAGCFEDKDLLPSLIPSSISLKHYVYFRIEIKRLIASIPTLEMNRETEIWHEDIADLWTGQLQHLRDRNYSITYDPSPVAHGFGDVNCIESGLEEDIQIFDVHSKEQPPPLIQLIDPETSDDVSVQAVLTTPVVSTYEFSEEEVHRAKSTDVTECFIANVPIPVFSEVKAVTTDNNASVHGFSEVEVARAKSTDIAEFFLEIDVPTDGDVQVSGNDLLLMTKDEITNVFKIDPITALKVYILFRRKIKCIPAMYDASTVKAFLQKAMLQSYTKKFEQYEIDGDMLLEANYSILKRIGVRKGLHCIKVKVLFPRYLHGTAPCCSCETISEWLKGNGMEKYIPVFEEEKIDGDIMQLIDEKCLKELNIDDKDMDKILQLKYKHNIVLQSTYDIIETDS